MQISNRIIYKILLASLPVMALGTMPAQACSYYYTHKTVPVWDEPDKGKGLVINNISSNSKVCSVGKPVINQGATWGKVKFFISNQLKINKTGWVILDHLKRAATPPTKISRLLGGTPLKNGKALFKSNWTLIPEKSNVTLLSVKKNKIMEAHHFGTLSGSVNKRGKARVNIDLSTLETGVDLRNVRMRFLFFEANKFPKASITALLNARKIQKLVRERKAEEEINIMVDLHGVQKAIKIPVKIAYLADGTINVSSAKPVMIKSGDFGFMPNLERLSKSVGNISILPIVPVSFDLLFAPAS